MKPLHLALLLSVLGSASALAHAAKPQSVEQIVDHHLAMSAANDVAGVMEDYADTAAVISPSGISRGRAAIEAVFHGIFDVPAGSRPKLVVTQRYFTGEVGYIAWVQNEGKPGETHGSDTFLIHRGKILAQTVAVFATPTAAH